MTDPDDKITPGEKIAPGEKIMPPYLKQGDTIGIVCPAGHMDRARAEQCMETLREWGFSVRPGKTLGRTYHYFSGTDAERLDDLQQMLDDPSVNAILCGRGGYGTSRIIDRLDFTRFKTAPKWIIGFSDITVLHTHVYSAFRTASLHAPMAGAFNGEGAAGPYVASLHKALTGDRTAYACASHPLNREGSAEAILAGGNLSLLTHLSGSVSELDTTGIILFLEDIGEYLYQIDRMMIQLQRSGKLENLAGLIVGGFTDMKDTVAPFGQTVEELIRDKVETFPYPVCFGFPVSHGKENYALKIGARYRLEVREEGTLLTEW
jgi:muramoyltetrapeptide carboxypeptidase